MWAKSRDGRPVKERPDVVCSDHGVDALRYAAMFLWNKDLSEPDKPPEYDEGTYGNLFGHSNIYLESAGLTDAIDCRKHVLRVHKPDDSTAGVRQPACAG